MGNSWIGTLVVLLVIAAQVIPAILQSINKKRREQQAREAAEARRSQQIPEEFRTPLPVEARGEAPTRPISEPIQSPKVDDLAARRKAQIEQLRNRREAQRTAAGVQVRTGGSGQTLPGGMRPVEMRPRTTLSPGLEMEAKRRQQEEARLRERRAAQSQAAQKQSTPIQKSKTRLANTGRGEAAITPQAQMRRDDAHDAEARQRRKETKSLHAVLRRPTAVREAFVLMELLDKPISLR